MGTTSHGDGSETSPSDDAALDPITTAKQTVKTELTENRTECQAYIDFKNRLADIEPVAVSLTKPLLASSQTVNRRQRQRKERLRRAFRETVMEVDHYEREYAEPLERHVAAELSVEVATGFYEESATAFTAQYKSTLRTAVETAIAQREKLTGQLETERASLKRSETAIAEVLAEYNGAIESSEPQSDYERQLEAIAQTRQETIQQQGSSTAVDGHDLHHYLYANYDWTYPVLTAITTVQSDSHQL